MDIEQENPFALQISKVNLGPEDVLFLRFDVMPPLERVNQLRDYLKKIGIEKVVIFLGEVEIGVISKTV